MKDVLGRAVDVGLNSGAEYVEVRAQKLFMTMLMLKEERVEAAKQSIEEGVAVRVLVKGSWGFASLGAPNGETLAKAVSGACRMAEAASSKLKDPVKLAQVNAVQDKVVLRPRKNPSEIPVRDKIETALDISSAVMGYDDRIKNCTVEYLDLSGTTFLRNSYDTYIEQDKLYVWSRIAVTAAEAGVFTYGREEIGSTAGYEVFDVESPEKTGEAVAKRAIEQLKAMPPRGGVFPVVLGPRVVGTFAHEAFGHLAEADLTLSGSVLAAKLGKRIGSDVVTLYDDGTIADAFGSFKYDDEGVLARKTQLVKDGVVVGLMHNLETAAKFGAEPTGNARAEDFRVEPIIRMRNTFLAPKDCCFEELLEGIEFGYYLKSVRGGQANLDGTFQVGIEEAYEIVNGELSRPVRDVSVSGNTLEILHDVDAVGKDFVLSPGRCGKGQTAFICDGGPHIRVKEMLVGGSA